MAYFRTGTNDFSSIKYTNLEAGNIKKGITVTVKDPNDQTLKSVTGTYKYSGPDIDTYFSGSGISSFYPSTSTQKIQFFLTSFTNYSIYNSGYTYKVVKGGTYNFTFGASGYNESGDRGTVSVLINGSAVKSITMLGIDRDYHYNNFSYNIPDNSYIELEGYKNNNDSLWAIYVTLRISKS